MGADMSSVAATTTIKLTTTPTSSIKLAGTVFAASPQFDVNDTTDISLLTTDQIVALTTNQIIHLTTDQIASLSSTQLNVLTPAQIKVVSGNQIQAISSAKISTLLTSQIGYISSSALNSLSSSQMRALTTDEIKALTTNQFKALATSQITSLSSAQIGAIETQDIKVLNTDDIATLGTDQILGVTTAQVTALTTAQIAALQAYQTLSLSTKQASALSVSQIRALNIDSTTAFSTKVISSLSATQIAAFTTAQVAVLTEDEIGAFTTNQIQALTTAQLQALTIDQITQIASSDIGALTNTQIVSLSTDKIAALTEDQLGGLKPSQIKVLKTSQVQALTNDQIQWLSSTQITALTTGQVAALKTEQLSNMDLGDLAAMTTSQISSFTTGQITALTNDEVAALTTAQIAALKTSQIQALSTDQFVSIETADIAALTTTQIATLSTDKITALSEDQIVALKSSQLTALKTSQINTLTSNQIQSLTTAQIATLKTTQVAALTTNQLANMALEEIAALTTAQISSLTNAQIGALTTDEITALTTAQTAALKTSQIQALSKAQFVSIETADIAALTTTQIASLSTDKITALSENQIGALTTSQLKGLKTSQINSLTIDQIQWLSTSQVSALTTAQVIALTATQLANMAPENLAAMTTAQISSLTTAQIAALTTDEVVALTTIQIPSLKANQIQALSREQFLSMGTDEIAALTTTQIASLSTDRIADLSEDQIGALKTSQLAALKTNQIQALTTDQVYFLSTAQVAALTTTQVAALKTAQLSSMELEDLAALTTAQIGSLTTSQMAALTTDETSVLTTIQIAALTGKQVAALTTDSVATLASNQINALKTVAIASLNTTQIATLSTSQLYALNTPQIAALTAQQLTAINTVERALALTIPLTGTAPGALSKLAITDTLSNVQSKFGALETMAKVKALASVTVIDDGSTPIKLTSTELTSNADIIAIMNNAKITITGVSAGNLTTTLATKNVTSVELVDSAANIKTNLKAIQSAVQAGKINSVTLTDTASLTIADTLAITKGLPHVTLATGIKLNVVDTASNIIAHARLDIGDVIKNAGTISLSDTATPNLTLADAKTLKGLKNLSGLPKYNIIDDSSVIAQQALVAGENVLNDATMITPTKAITIAEANLITSLKSLTIGFGYAIQDTAANVIAESLNKASSILTKASIVNVADTTTNITNNLDSLEVLAKSGAINDIVLTDADTHPYVFTDSQLAKDAEAIGKMPVRPIQTTIAAKATQNLQISVNLPANAQPITVPFDKTDPRTYNTSTTTTIFDSLGNPTAATIYFTKTQNSIGDSAGSIWQTHLTIAGVDVSNQQQLMKDKDTQGNALYINKFGQITANPQAVDPTFNPIATQPLFYADDQSDKSSSTPATVVGGIMKASGFDFGDTDANPVTIVTDPALYNTTRESGSLQAMGSNPPYWGVDMFSVAVDGSAPQSISINAGNYTGTQLAAELTRAVNAKFGDDRYININDTYRRDGGSIVQGNDIIQLNLSRLAEDGSSVSMSDPIEIDLLGNGGADGTPTVNGAPAPDTRTKLTTDELVALAQTKLNDALNKRHLEFAKPDNWPYSASEPPIKVGYDMASRALTFTVAQNQLGPDANEPASRFNSIQVFNPTDVTNDLGIPRKTISPDVLIRANTLWTGSAIVPNGDFITEPREQRTGISVIYNKDTRQFSFSSGSTGEGSSISVGRARLATSADINAQVDSFNLDSVDFSQDQSVTLEVNGRQMTYNYSGANGSSDKFFAGIEQAMPVTFSATQEIEAGSSTSTEIQSIDTFGKIMNGDQFKLEIQPSGADNGTVSLDVGPLNLIPWASPMDRLNILRDAINSSISAYNASPSGQYSPIQVSASNNANKLYFDYMTNGTVSSLINLKQTVRGSDAGLAPIFYTEPTIATRIATVTDGSIGTQNKQSILFQKVDGGSTVFKSMDKFTFNIPKAEGDFITATITNTGTGSPIVATLASLAAAANANSDISALGVFSVDPSNSSALLFTYNNNGHVTGKISISQAAVGTLMGGTYESVQVRPTDIGPLAMGQGMNLEVTGDPTGKSFRLSVRFNGVVKTKDPVGAQGSTSKTGVQIGNAIGTEFEGNNDLLGIGVKYPPYSIPGTGLPSTAATAVGARGVTPMTQTFLLNESLGENKMTFTVDGIVGTITLPIKAYTGDTFAAAIQERVNQIQDPRTGRGVSGVTVTFDAERNRLTFTSGTTGSNSQINVVGHANFGLYNVTQTPGTNPLITNLKQATDAQGNKLYVDAQGNITTQAPNALQNWYSLYLHNGALSFDSSGQLNSPTESILFPKIDLKDGANLLNLNLSIAKSSTQTNAPFSLYSAYQDGTAATNIGGQLPTNMIGKMVLAASNIAVADSYGGISGAIDLQSNVSALQLQVLKLNGQLVKTINLGQNPPGLTAFNWDGYDDRGDPVGGSNYILQATATSNGKQLQAATYVYGQVTAQSDESITTGSSLTVAGVGNVNVADVRAYKTA